MLREGKQDHVCNIHLVQSPWQVIRTLYSWCIRFGEGTGGGGFVIVLYGASVKAIKDIGQLLFMVLIKEVVNTTVMK